MANTITSSKTSQAHSAGSGQATSMAQLMARPQKSFVTVKKGDVVKGKITRLSKNEIAVDINAKAEAIVLEKDKNILHSLLKQLKVGDEVSVSVLSPESDTGNPVVSLRRFIDEIVWNQMEAVKKERVAIEVTVADTTKGGLVIKMDNGMSGFLPNSHMTGGNGQELIGKRIPVVIIELQKPDNKIIVSQKSSLSPDVFKEMTKGITPGSKQKVTVGNVTPFGIFVTIPGNNGQLDGLIHISEIAWEKVEDITGYTQGQEIEVMVIGVDSESMRIDLSIKRLTSDPFEKSIEKFPLEKKVTALVTRIDDTGAYLSLDSATEGIIRKEKIPAGITYTVGQEVAATVSEIDKRRHRILLTPVLKEKPLMYR